MDSSMKPSSVKEVSLSMVMGAAFCKEWLGLGKLGLLRIAIVLS